MTKHPNSTYKGLHKTFRNLIRNYKTRHHFNVEQFTKHGLYNILKYYVHTHISVDCIGNGLLGEGSGLGDGCGLMESL